MLTLRCYLLRWSLSLKVLIAQFPFFLASEIQMMTIPQGQYVITETAVGTPVTTVNTGQVKAVTQVRKKITASSFHPE